MKRVDVLIIGGGAAGFFTAINLAKLKPSLSIVILERGKEVLTKVKVSGGGRCNVTHAQFDPSELVVNYPRGSKELLGPFHKFMTGDTIAWFEERGIALKIEEDGRMFPTTNSSQTIIDCFINEAQEYGIPILNNHVVKKISPINENWLVTTNQGDFMSSKIMVATGSNTKIWKILEELGHTIVTPVPSLFTFNIDDERLHGIPGISLQDVGVKVVDSQLESSGPLLITHVGLSGPAILKLSAFGAILLASRDYKFQIEINFIGFSTLSCIERLKEIKSELNKKFVINSQQFDLPKRLWSKLVTAASIEHDRRWSDLKKEQLDALAQQLTGSIYEVNGKSTFKEEFVTAGGIDLKEINFKTFESKLFKNLYFAGEVLNIDAITGGFNFQNAWTGGYIAAEAISKTN